MSFLLLGVASAVFPQGEADTLKYEWQHHVSADSSIDLYFALLFPQTLQEMLTRYSLMNHESKSGKLGSYLSNDPFSSVIDTVAGCLAKLAEEANLRKEAVALSFVQSLEHFPQEGYQRYAAEMLISQSGSAADKAVLLAAILRIWDVECIFCHKVDSGDVCVCIAAAALDHPQGHWVEFEDERYYACDAINPEQPIGRCPENFMFGHLSYEKID